MESDVDLGDVLAGITEDELQAVATPSQTGVKLCRNCAATLPTNAVLCVACGLDLRSGEVRRTSHEAELGYADVPTFGSKMKRVSVKRLASGELSIETSMKSFGRTVTSTIDLRGCTTVRFMPSHFKPSRWIFAIMVPSVICSLFAYVLPGLIVGFAWWGVLQKMKTVLHYCVVVCGNGREKMVCRCDETNLVAAERAAEMIHKTTGFRLQKEFGLLD
jgi:ribosomal protein L40E